MGTWRAQSGDELVQQAQRGWQDAAGNMPSQMQGELGQIVEELTNRVTFACSGKKPERHTLYSSLAGDVLSQQAHITIARATQVIPLEQRDYLELIGTLAERVEFASSGSPGTAVQQQYAQTSQKFKPIGVGQSS